MIRVLIWNEYRHEKCQPEVAKIYPQGMHAAIGEYLMQDEDIIVKLACLDDPEQGLSEEALAETDVLVLQLIEQAIFGVQVVGEQ